MRRKEILQTASQAIRGQRQADYGDARTNFDNIAALWAPILGVTPTPEQVALCMTQVKVARLLHSPDHADSWVDAAGYIALGGEIALTQPDGEQADTVAAVNEGTVENENWHDPSLTEPEPTLTPRQASDTPF